MDPRHIRILDQHRFKIVQEMDAMDTLDVLVGAEIFNDHHKSQVIGQPAAKDKNRTLLDILKTRGDKAFDAFVDALRETGQHVLANLLASAATQNPPVAAQPAGFSGGAAGGANLTSNPLSNLTPEENRDRNQLRSNTIEQNKRALQRILPDFCESVRAEAICIYLMRRTGGTAMRNLDYQTIMAGNTPFARNRELYDYIQRKDQEEFNCFIDALFASGQLNIARMML